MKTQISLSKRTLSRGFTLMELMVVMTIIAILAAMSFAGGKAAMVAARKKSAERDALSLKNAISTYFTEYRKFPVASGTTGGSDYRTTTNNTLMDVLLAADNNKLNPRGIAFFNGRAAKGGRGGVILSSSGGGRLVDAWGKEYGVMIDTDYDNKIRPPFGNAGAGAMLAETIIVWSSGPDEEEGTDDDVTTW